MIKGLHAYGLGAAGSPSLLTLDQYMTGLNNVFDTPQGVDAPGNRWSPASHAALSKWAKDLFGVEDVSRFARWGQDPAFTAFFCAGLLLGLFDMPGGWDKVRPLYEALGIPVSSSAETARWLGEAENAVSARRLLDQVILYISGAEGASTFGNKGVETRGIVSMIAAPVIGIAIVALL